MIDLLTPDQIDELENDMHHFSIGFDVTQEKIDQMKQFADLLNKYAEISQGTLDGLKNKESNTNQV